MGTTAPIELGLAPGAVVIVEGDVESQGAPVFRAEESGFLDLEFDDITLVGFLGLGEPVGILSEGGIIGLVIPPGAVGGEDVLTFKVLSSPTRVVAFIGIEEDLDTVVDPGLSILGSSFGGVGKDFIIGHIHPDIDRLIVVGHPVGVTVIALFPSVVSGRNVVDPGMPVDDDGRGSCILVGTQNPVNGRGGGFRRGQLLSADHQVAVAGFDMGLTRPDHLTFPRAAVVVVIDGDAESDDVSGFGVADGIERNPKFRVPPGIRVIEVGAGVLGLFRAIARIAGLGLSVGIVVGNDELPPGVDDLRIGTRGVSFGEVAIVAVNEHLHAVVLPGLSVFRFGIRGIVPRIKVGEPDADVEVVAIVADKEPEAEVLVVEGGFAASQLTATDKIFQAIIHRHPPIPSASGGASGPDPRLRIQINDPVNGGGVGQGQRVAGFCGIEGFREAGKRAAHREEEEGESQSNTHVTGEVLRSIGCSSNHDRHRRRLRGSRDHPSRCGLTSKGKHIPRWLLATIRDFGFEALANDAIC